MATPPQSPILPPFLFNADYRRPHPWSSQKALGSRVLGVERRRVDRTVRRKSERGQDGAEAAAAAAAALAEFPHFTFNF